MVASKVVLLGTGTPNAEPSRSGSGVAIVVKGQPYIIDFGPGIIRRSSAAQIDLTKLDIAFLSHLHSDHTTAYPDLIFTPWVLGRRKPLNVYGPEGLQELTKNILLAYRADINERIKGLEPINTTGYEVKANEIMPGETYQDENVKVETFQVNHGSWQAFGHKFILEDKTIVVSGDTAPFKGIEECYRDCDILIHEVYSVKGLKNRSKEWQEYHKKVHTSTHELAEIACKVRPKLVVLYHQLSWEISENELLDEIKEKYSGEVVSGKDLDIFT